MGGAWLEAGKWRCSDAVSCRLGVMSCSRLGAAGLAWLAGCAAGKADREAAGERAGAPGRPGTSAPGIVVWACLGRCHSRERHLAGDDRHGGNLRAFERRDCPS